MRSKIFIGVLISFLFGLSVGQSSRQSHTRENIACYASRETVTIVGRVAEEPDLRRDQTKYTIQVENLKTRKEATPVSGLVLISTEKYPTYSYGDQLEITGKLERPGIFDDFDYAGYLSRYDIYAIMNRPKIRSIKDSAPTSAIYQILLRIKNSFTNHLSLTFPSEPSNSLMAGLLLGSRKGMPEELTKDFQVTGLTHIVAISGYNITLIVSIMMLVFRALGKRTSIVLSAGGIILFTIFVGASAAVVRACLMGLIGLIALNHHRKTDVTITLLIAAVIMCAWNPKILHYDVGFQLSFLATMGLIYIAPLLTPKLSWLPEKFAIRESMALTLSAQIMALPVLLLNFHQLSLIAPLSNLLVAGPIIPFTMFFGFLGTLSAYLSTTLAKIIAFPGYLLSEYITQVVHLTAQIPYAAITIPWFSETLLVTYFGLLIIIVSKYGKILQRIERRVIQYQLSFQQQIAQTCLRLD
jgi:competence protein ComEC